MSTLKPFKFANFPDFFSASQLSKKNLQEFYSLASKLEKLSNKKKLSFLKGKILGTLFFEASTRTRLSFESAALRLGMNTLGFAGIQGTSAAKGESISDTVIMASGYADVLAIRSPIAGLVESVKRVSKVPVINAGDGANEHPSQALLDYFTLRKEFKNLKGLEVCFAGDLKYGRTFHSTAKFLVKDGAKVSLYQESGLNAPKQLIKELFKNKKPKIYKNLKEAANADVLYLTRVQDERFKNKALAKKANKKYIFKKEFLKKNPKLKIMHPLPRNQEIPKALDSTKANLYFKQAQNASIAREALLYSILKSKTAKKVDFSYK